MKEPAADLITKRIAELGDWRGKALSKMRKLIKQADPDVVEEWKWMGTPVWSHDGIICTGESYKDKVKLTFAKGASLKDPGRLFNSSLDGNVRRAIDILEGKEVDESAFKALVRQAVALNGSKNEAFEEKENKVIQTSDPVSHALAQYKAAVYAKDVNAFVSLYEDDVHVFDMWNQWELRGIDAWRSMAEGWFGSLATEHVVVSFNDVVSTVGADLALGHATVTYTAVSAEGKELRSLDNRMTIALRRTSGAWKIFHEHTSGPIEHTSLKGMHQARGRLTTASISRHVPGANAVHADPPDARAHQSQRRETDVRRHAANLAVLAFAQR